MRKYAFGSAHGRFQPFHNGHLKYLLAAKEQCEFLWVGITQHDIHDLTECPLDPHRQEKLHNPLTFYERHEMISQALLDIGLSRNEFDIIPFPIENPSCLPDFLPINIPVFTTIYDEWNKHKIEVLKQQGYKVIVLWEEDKKNVDGITIRKQILLGNDSWKQSVPKATIEIIEKYNIQERLRSLK